MACGYALPGIAPASVPAFIGAQWVGAVVGLALVAVISTRGATEQGQPAV